MSSLSRRNYSDEVSMALSSGAPQPHTHEHQYFESSPAQVKQSSSRAKSLSIQQLSPIKSVYSDSYDFQFGHSTPNAHLLRQSPMKKYEQTTPRSPSNMTQSHTLNTEFEIPLNYEANNHKNKNKKQNLIKTLASNILQLNSLSNQAEKLENDLKYGASDTLQNELNRIRSDMLVKIDSIHSIEQELAKIDGNLVQISSKRDDSTMNEIRQILKEMIYSSQSQNTTRSSGINHTLTVNKMLEQVEKATAMTANTLLSTIVKPKPIKSSSSSDSTTAFTASTSSNLSTNALQKIDSFKMHLEAENQALKRKVNELDEKFHSLESKQTDLSEVESLKTLIRKTHAQFEADKQRLIREFEVERHANMDQVQKFKRELETRLSEKENELKDSLRQLQSVVSSQQQMNAPNESSFLTEEEDAIRRISSQINSLKRKIDVKSRLNENDSSDNDTKELITLNDQIRMLKNRMLIKGDRLDRLKTSLSNPNLASDKIYLPINHSKIIKSSDDDEVHLIKPTKKVAINPKYYAEDEDEDEYHSSSPERRYTSSIEIPAEQVEAIKLTPVKKRSKSVDRHMTMCVRNVQPFSELQIELEESQKQIQELRRLLEEKNRLLGAQKSEPKPDKDLNYLLKTLEKQDKKVSVLKRKLKEAKLEGNVNSDTMSSISESYEQVKSTLKENLKKIDEKKHAKKTRAKRVTIKDTSMQANETDILSQPQQQQQINQDVYFAPVEQEFICNVPEHHDLEDLLHEHREEIDRLRIVIDATPIENKRAEFEALDLAINNRKQVLFDLELEKRRTLNESLIENEDFNEGRVRFLKDEISCLEATLHKRTKEFNLMKNGISQGRREIMLIKEKKISLEKEIKKLKTERSKLNEEAQIFEKKADKATIELIQTTEELENAKKLRRDLEEDLIKVKNELNSFLSIIKSDKYELKSKNSASVLEKLLFSNDTNIQSLQENIHVITTKHKEAQKLEASILKQNVELNEVNKIIAKQKQVLQNLDGEIASKKCEIDLLRDKSIAYTNEFKHEIDTCEADINKFKRQKEELNGDLKKLTVAIDEIVNNLKQKNELLASRQKEIESIDVNLREVTRKYEEIDQKLKDRLTEKAKIDVELDRKQAEMKYTVDCLANQQKSLDSVKQDLCTDKTNLDNVKTIIDSEKKILSQLSEEKFSLEKKLTHLSTDLNKLNDEYKKREKQLSELNNLTKEKQNMVKKEEDEVQALEDEKTSLINELQSLRDKLKKRKQIWRNLITLIDK